MEVTAWAGLYRKLHTLGPDSGSLTIWFILDVTCMSKPLAKFHGLQIQWLSNPL